MKKLLFSPKAEADLVEIGDYIARDNIDRALSFIREIEAHCRRIAEMPVHFIKRPDIAPDIQMVVHRNYLILFHVDRNIIRIERVIHGARNMN